MNKPRDPLTRHYYSTKYIHEQKYILTVYDYIKKHAEFFYLKCTYHKNINIKRNSLVCTPCQTMSCWTQSKNCHCDQKYALLFEKMYTLSFHHINTIYRFSIIWMYGYKISHNFKEYFLRVVNLSVQTHLNVISVLYILLD